MPHPPPPGYNRLSDEGYGHPPTLPHRLTMCPMRWAMAMSYRGPNLVLVMEREAILASIITLLTPAASLFLVHFPYFFFRIWSNVWSSILWIFGFLPIFWFIKFNFYIDFCYVTDITFTGCAKFYFSYLLIFDYLIATLIHWFLMLLILIFYSSCLSILALDQRYEICHQGEDENFSNFALVTKSHWWSYQALHWSNPS